MVGRGNGKEGINFKPEIAFLSAPPQRKNIFRANLTYTLLPLHFSAYGHGIVWMESANELDMKIAWLCGQLSLFLRLFFYFITELKTHLKIKS